MAIKDDIKTAFERSPGQTLLRDPAEFATNTAIAAGAVSVGALLGAAIAGHLAGGTVTAAALQAKQQQQAGILARTASGAAQIGGGIALGGLAQEGREAFASAFELGEGGVRQLRSIIEDPNATPEQRELAKKELKVALESTGTGRLTGLFTDISEAEFGRRQAKAQAEAEEPSRELQKELQTGKSLETQSRFIQEINKTPLEQVSTGAKKQAAIALSTGEEQRFLLQKKQEETEEQKRKNKQKASKTSKTRT